MGLLLQLLALPGALIELALDGGHGLGLGGHLLLERLNGEHCLIELLHFLLETLFQGSLLLFQGCQLIVFLLHRLEQGRRLLLLLLKLSAGRRQLGQHAIQLGPKLPGFVGSLLELLLHRSCSRLLLPGRNRGLFQLGRGRCQLGGQIGHLCLEGDSMLLQQLLRLANGCLLVLDCGSQLLQPGCGVGQLGLETVRLAGPLVQLLRHGGGSGILLLGGKRAFRRLCLGRLELAGQHGHLGPEGGSLLLQLLFNLADRLFFLLDRGCHLLDLACLGSQFGLRFGKPCRNPGRFVGL